MSSDNEMTWGGPLVGGCDGWKLVASPRVIESLPTLG